MTDAPPTPAATLIRAREIGRECGLRYVYTGNVNIDGAEDTLCHQCGRAVVERVRYKVLNNRLNNGHCPDCGAAIDGIWRNAT